MIWMPQLLATCALTALLQTAPGPASPQQRVVVPRNIFDAKLLVGSCDRLVVARVREIQEFDREPGSLGQPTPPKIRIADLEVISAPFGSMSENLHVRLPEGATPAEVGVWPLGRNLLAADDDWNAFARIEKDLHADPLWMPSSKYEPWSMRTTANDREVLVPGWMLKTRAEANSKLVDRFASRWITVGELEAALADELTRSAPRTEAEIVSMGPGNWQVMIQGNGQGTLNMRPAFRWSDEQRARWEQAVVKFEFASMPNRVGSSPAPCSPVLVLSRVTAAGRRSVHYSGDGPRDGAPDPWGLRFAGLWAELRALVPN